MMAAAISVGSISGTEKKRMKVSLATADYKHLET
jgi:hypothetical protein